MPRRFLPTLVASFALVLVCAGSAAAASLTFDGHVFRYREKPGESGEIALRPAPRKAPTHLQVWVSGLDFASGCRQLPPEERAKPPYPDMRCPLGPVPAERLRLRLSLFDGDDSVETYAPLRALVYAGEGDDVAYGDRVYGADGNDWIVGRRLYGGRGEDFVNGENQSIAFGGPGKDELIAGGRLYGGPGDDEFRDAYSKPSNDMMVGGPGHDLVGLGDDGLRDVVRVRGGGVDRVVCGIHPAEEVLFVDPSDRLSPSCKNATVLYTARPRYPYP